MKKIVKGILVILLLITLAYVSIELYKTYKPSGNNQISKEKKEKEQLEDRDVKNSIFKNSYKKAVSLVSKMTLKEKVGQLFLVRYNVNDVEYLSNFYPGGYILFAKDFNNHNKNDIKKEIENDQKLNKYPLIIAVDEEGGYVTRVSRYQEFRNEKFKSPKSYYEEGGYDLLEQTENEKLTLLRSLGINLNLAPVADISTDPNDFMYTRSFGKNSEETSEYIKNMVTYANNNKIGSCLKHFPGYGNNEDTHTGIAIDNRTYENFLENDFKPFKAGIDANVPSILVSHNIINSMDSKYPASLSSNVIKELRETLGFTGIIMTDDLAMDAVKSYVEDGKAATLAINAGNDMLITSDFIPMYKEILQGIENGEIKEETINKAVIRIIAWKYYSELF